jgi:hypothetical protein
MSFLRIYLVINEGIQKSDYPIRRGGEIVSVDSVLQVWHRQMTPISAILQYAVSMDYWFRLAIRERRTGTRPQLAAQICWYSIMRTIYSRIPSIRRLSSDAEEVDGRSLWTYWWWLWRLKLQFSSLRRLLASIFLEAISTGIVFSTIELLKTSGMLICLPNLR